MRDPLVRFGVAIEESLLRELDGLAAERRCTRSELLRDLARSAVGRAKVPKGIDAVGTLTLVYDHHVRDLSEKLTALQHELGDGVRAALHIHLSHELCLEVVVMHGKSDRLQAIADRVLAMRGVKQGGLEIIPRLGAGAGSARGGARSGEPSLEVGLREHAHAPGHIHAHGVAHASASETVPSRASARGPAGRRARPAKTDSPGSPPARPRRARNRRG